MLRVIEFKSEYRPGRNPLEWVLVAPLGEEFLKTQTWHLVSHVKPKETSDRNILESASYQDLLARWSIIGPKYEAWKSGQELPEDGTPLAAWSGVTPEQAQALRTLGIKTVEDVRDAGEEAMKNMRFPNARKLPALAREFLDGADASAKDARIAELEERMAAMAEMLEEKLAAEAPRRGRPRKEDAA